MNRAIKATNCKKLKIINCKFVGFDTAIEIENVDEFLSENNKFLKSYNPEELILALSGEINKSNLNKKEKKVLYNNIIEVLSSKKISEQNSKKVLRTLSRVGDEAVAFFKQLVAGVSAGLIINFFSN